MKLTYKLFFIFAIFFSLKNIAGDATKPQKIAHYQFYKTHTGLLVRQATMIDPDNCGRKDLYVVDKSHPHYSEIVSLVLAAHIAGQPLAFYLDGCAQGLPSISHVYSDK